MQGLGKAVNLITPILLLFGWEHIMLFFWMGTYLDTCGWEHILVLVDGNHLLSAFLLAIGLQACYFVFCLLDNVF